MIAFEGARRCRGIISLVRRRGHQRLSVALRLNDGYSCCLLPCSTSHKGCRVFATIQRFSPWAVILVTKMKAISGAGTGDEMGLPFDFFKISMDPAKWYVTNVTGRPQENVSNLSQSESS